MNESVHQPPRPRRFSIKWVWLILFVLIVIIMTIVGFATNVPQKPPYALMALIVAAAGATILVLLGKFGYSLRSWRNVRRTLVSLAAFATLIALFYLVEDIRGKRAWTRCKQELAAKGLVLDWNAYIPPPVPDDQNFFKAPNMQEWFTGRGERELTKRMNSSGFRDTNVPPLLLAELTIVPRGQSSSEGGDVALNLGDPAAREKAQRLIRDALGASITGNGAYGFTFLDGPATRVQAVRVRIEVDHVPTTNELAQLFPLNAFQPVGYTEVGAGWLRVQSAGPNSFRVVVDPGPVSAADFLAWGDKFQPDLDQIRSALQRPYARMEGDYQVAEMVPIPNFVVVRQLSQFLASRAKCHLLLGQSDKALQDVTLINELCRALEGRPTSKPMTLVAAMINVAVRGLYTDTLAEGFRRRAWHEPQLIALQDQLKQIDLTPFVLSAFKTEPASSCSTLESTSRKRLAEICFHLIPPENRNASSTWTDPREYVVRLMPRGWLYQNIAAITADRLKLCDGFDERGLIRPRTLDSLSQEFSHKFDHFTPYTFLGAIFTPNFTRAAQVLGRNQTLVNEAFVACALERYHLAHGEYPESLDALAPQFVEVIPHEIIGGEPLKYHRTSDGRFLLYSIGWNETDDNGLVVLGEPAHPTYDQGDWVWLNGNWSGHRNE